MCIMMESLRTQQTVAILFHVFCQYTTFKIALIIIARMGSLNAFQKQNYESFVLTLFARIYVKVGMHLTHMWKALILA